MPVKESANSPRYNSDGSLERIFNVWDVDDDTQAIGLAMAAASPTYSGRARQAMPTIEPAGGPSVWTATFKYEYPEGQAGGFEDPDPNFPAEGTLEISVSSQTTHITVALHQRHAPADAPRRSHVIGVSYSGGEPVVEGTDIIVPKMTLTLTRRPPTVSGAYVANLGRLVGKVNAAPYTIYGQLAGVFCQITFQAGELLFTGCNASDARFVYEFEASENGNIVVSDSIEPVFKKGHEYFWVAYKNSVNANALVQEPAAVYIATVYDEVDYYSYLGF